MSMLNEFFSITGDKSIFDGLEITKDQTICDGYMGKYPALFVSFKDIVATTFDGACAQMRKIISIIDAVQVKYNLQNIGYTIYNDTGIFQKYVCRLDIMRFSWYH